MNHMRMQKNSFQYHATSHYVKSIMTQMHILNENPKMNAITVKCLQANQINQDTSCKNFMPVKQIIKKFIHLTQQYVKCNNTIPFVKMRLFQAK